jgi:hypothetical protein
MKKIALSLAGVLAAAAFAPEASAVPVFARQTGMACTACHFQHFPLLNGFGRAFKSAGYTMMGAQAKVESEGLDIPAVVNLGGFTTTFFQTQSAGTTAGVSNAVDPGVPKWGVPGTGGELSLFMGGRLSEFAGFLAEAGLGGSGSANTGGVVGAAKLAMLFPAGDARMGLVVHSSNNQGVAYSFELLNTGAANTHKMMGNPGPSDQHVRAFSAAQYLKTNSAATGISLVANNSSGFVVLGAYEMAGNGLVGGANNMNLTYMRLAGTTDVDGWDVGFGLQNFGGKSQVTLVSPKATIIDVQAQGEMAGMATGFYASLGTAAAGTANAVNPFNPDGGAGGGKSASSLNLAAELGVIPHVSTLQAALRMAKNGAAVNAVSGKAVDADNAFMIGVTYELAQNMAVSFTRTIQFGSAWNGANYVASGAGSEPAGKTANTLLLEALF